MASKLRTLTVNAASRFASSFGWRGDIENLREEERFDEALDIYSRFGKDKDNAIELLLLGQKAEIEGDIDMATKHWGSIENGNAKEHALMVILTLYFY